MNLTRALVLFLYLLSGVAALAYEVLWARQISLVFGVSNFGIVITVSAFLAGLGLGSFFTHSRPHFFKKPFLVFAFLELSVGAFAFFSPLLFAFVDEAILAAASGWSLSAWYAAQAVALFLLMLLPAFILGAGFPILLRACGRLNIHLAYVYGLNTFGGVLGCFLPLLLLPEVGWTVSVRLVSFLSIFVAAAFFFLHARQPALAESEGQHAAEPKPAKHLLAYATIGACAIMLQIAWSRMFGMLLLRTEYVVAILIASYLIGIGVGSLLYQRLHLHRLVFVLPLLVVVSVISFNLGLPFIAQWAETHNFAHLQDALLQQAGVIVLVTLPATLAFGAWLPFLADRLGAAEYSGAKLYAFNSVGSAVGAILAGFVFMPLVGTTWVIFISAAVVLLVSMLWVKQRWYKPLALLCIVAMAPLSFFPAVATLLPVSQAGSQDLFLKEDALAVTHVVENKQGHRILMSDLQRLDASTEPTAITVQKNQGLLPQLLHGDSGEFLFLGLGTGITASGVQAEQAQLTAVELSAGSIEAAQSLFEKANQRIAERISIKRDDARRFLKGSSEQFDVIVGDLFHPDLVGRSALLSRQQFARAKTHLRQDGIFVQWIALNQFDVYSLKVVLNTFRSVFADAVLFVDGFRIALVGCESRCDFSHLLVPAKDDALEESNWTWLGRYWGPVPEFNTRLQDEWEPVIEFALPQAKYTGQIDLRKNLSFLLRMRPKLELAATQLGLPAALRGQFRPAFEATNMIFTSWLAALAGDQGASVQFLRQAFESNRDDRWIGFEIADRLFAALEQQVAEGRDRREVLQKILQIRPDHVEALRQLWRLERAAGNFQSAAEYAQRILQFSPYDAELTAASMPGNKKPG